VTFSNTTPLFAFAALGRFELLEQVHRKLSIVETVVQECEVGGPIRVPNLRTLSWITIHPAPSQPDEQGDYTRERFVAKSGMKRFFHRQDAKCAKPN
jgi:predicted nucleic acid-binding protein